MDILIENKKRSGSQSSRITSFKKLARVIGNTVTDPCVVSNFGLLINSFTGGGVPGMVVNSIGEPAYVGFRVINELKKDKDRPVLIEASLPHNLQSSFRVLPQSSIKAGWQKVKQVVYAYSDYARALKVQASFQVGLAVVGFGYSFWKAGYDFPLLYNQGKVGVLVAASVLAIGNWLEANKETARQHNSQKEPISEARRPIQKISPYLLRFRVAKKIADNKAAKFVGNAALFCFFDPHAYWTVGLAYMAQYQPDGPAPLTPDRIAALVACGAGFGVTMMRNVAPAATQKAIGGLNRLNDAIAAALTAEKNSAARRAVAWYATMPTRGLRWMLDNKESPLFCTAAAFAAPMIGNGLGHFVNGMRLDMWGQAKNAFYGITQLSLIANERHKGVVEALFPSMRLAPMPNARFVPV